LKRFALLFLFASACKTVPVADGTFTGGATPRAAVERYLAGAYAQDMQAVGAVFGNDKGPAREQYPRATLETQFLVQLSCFRSGKATISGPTIGERGSQIFSVGLTQGKLEASVPFVVVKGPSNRWYVQQFEIIPLQNKGFCSKSGG
jgi:hypothetical protein